MRRRLRRFGRWLLRLTALGVVLALIAGAYFYDYPRVAADLPEAVLAYRGAGLPWTAKDLAPNPPVRPEENAALLLRTAIAAWPQHEVVENGRRRTVYLDEAGKAAMYGESLAPLLPPLAHALALAHEAAQRSRLDFGRDWDLGFSLEMPEPGRIKAIVQVLDARAELRAEAGNDTGALFDLEDARRLGVLIGSEPSVISALVGVACDRMTMSAAIHCLGTTGPSAARVALYAGWLARPTPLFDLRQALRGEAYGVVAGVRNFERMRIGTSLNFFLDQSALSSEEGLDLTPDPRTLRRDGCPTLQRPRAYLARALRRWTDLAESTNRLNASMETIAVEASAIEAESYGRLPTLSGIFDPLTFRTLAQFDRSNNRAQASRTLALLYADALLQHAGTGTWPTSSPVPDPLGEGTLHVRFDHGRFRVWSVGNDGVDDGGLTPGEASDAGKRSDDLVAAYPPVPRRYAKRFADAGKAPPSGFRGD